MDFESIKSIPEFAGLGMDFMFSPPCIEFGYGFWKSGYGFCYFGKSILRFLKSRYGFCKVIKSIPEKQNPYWVSSRGVNFGRKFVNGSVRPLPNPPEFAVYFGCAPCLEPYPFSEYPPLRKPPAERKYTKIQENPYLTFKIRTCLLKSIPASKIRTCLLKSVPAQKIDA
ncbi:MAG: hypothetical protein QXS19_04820 [Candidatus Methanomethylicia archaeon]